MSESVQFWLDNKMSAGIKMAEVGEQLLVLYREKYYVVEQGAAQMKGGRPLHYSKSSMPAIWKKALRGESPSPDSLKALSDETLPVATSTKRVRSKKDDAAPAELFESETQTHAPAPVQSPPSVETKSSGRANKTKSDQITQTTVIANCPYCNHKHELSLDKGKNGKPFFMMCAKCKTDFAVRIVPVTVYQAKVAGFR